MEKIKDWKILWRFKLQKLEIRNDDSILIVAPHPDDECIGMGGFLSLYGSQCDVLIVSDGAKGKSSGTDEQCISIRVKELADEMAFYRVHNYQNLNLPDGMLSTVGDMFPHLNLGSYTKVFCINRDDVSIDHRATYEMLIRTIKKSGFRGELYMYEVTYPLRSVSHFIDISECFQLKEKGIEFHKSQLAIFDYKSTALALNHYRATWIKEVESYAEAFLKLSDIDMSLSNNKYEIEIQQLRRELLIEESINDVMEGNMTMNSRIQNAPEIYIYGYGKYGKRIEQLFHKVGLKIGAIIDQNKGAQNLYSQHGTEIVTLNQFEPNDGVVVITIINTKIASEIKKMLQKKIDTLTIEQIFG